MSTCRMVTAGAIAGLASGGRSASLRRRLRADDERQGEALLVLVLALLVAVADLADGVGAEEEDLGDSLPRIDLGRQRRGVADLDGHLAAPLGLQGRYIHNDAAITDEDAGLQREVAGLGDRQAVDVVSAADGTNCLD